MTKKLFIIFLTLCLAVVGMTVIATAETLDSIEIGGITLSSGQYVNSGLGDTPQTGDPTYGTNYAYYLNGTLYLNNFTIEAGDYTAISSAGDLTIVFSGSNSLTANGYDGIYVSGALTINGSTGATLNVTSAIDAIYCCGTLSVSGATVSATGDSYAIYSHGMTISSSTVSATATTYGICGDGSGSTVEIVDSTITTNADTGIYAYSTISISGDVDITAVGGIKSYSSSINITPSTDKILEVTVGSTTSYISSATTLSNTTDTVTIKPHTHSYVNNECACGAKDYGTIEVGYVTLKDGQYALVDGPSMTVYDGTPTGTSYAYFSGGVLYLNNYLYRDGIFYNSSGNLTINLTGTSFITYVEVYGNLSISGTGSLTVTAEDYGLAAISVGGDITIEGVTIDVTSNEGFAMAIETQGSVIISGSNVTLSASVTEDANAANAIDTWGDIIIDNGSTLTATASSTGENGIAHVFYAYGSIFITDSTVTKIEASGYAGHAMYAQMGAITITNSTVNVSATATADENASYGYDGRAIYASAGDVTITKSTVTASATAQKSYAVYAGGDVAISGESTVTTTATANGDGGYSYGIYAGNDVSLSGNSVTATATASGTGSEGSAIFAYGGSINITESEVDAEATGYKIDGAILTYSADKDITITDSNVTATSTSGVYRDNGGAIATYDTGSDIIISGSKITATSISNSTTRKNFGAISAMGSVNVSESELELESTGGYVYGALHAEENIVVSDSELEATADGIVAYAMVAIDGKIDISGSNVSATATGTTAQSAIYVISGDISITDSAVVADGGIDTDTGSVNIYAVDYAWDIKAGTSSASSTTKVYLGTNGSLKASADAWDESWSVYDYISITKSTHVHSYTSSVTTEATCTTDGVMTYTCTCGDSYTETI